MRPSTKTNSPVAVRSVILRGKFFIIPTAFARIIAGWLSKSGIPASVRIATLKCSPLASCPLSGQASNQSFPLFRVQPYCI